ncbi:MAG: DUF2071 domain-containing protein [Candidatus Protochlamydia sp.]|nr:DUF2071 domain-containing protein [Candidatus Protochlamydia sp.]
MPIPTHEARLAARDYPKDLWAIMDQKWRNLLFQHWEYDVAAIQSTLPPGLFVDTFEGKAYIGITPFSMEGVKPKFFPSIPGLSNFLELNVRTYVYNEQGIPGVWFYSLDANQQIAVQMASQFFFLPYRYAQMESNINANGEIIYKCTPQGTVAKIELVYSGKGPTFNAKADSLEFFLVERYVLFAKRGDAIATGRIHHAPYALSFPDVKKWDSQLFEINGLVNPKRAPDHLLFSPGVDVEIFRLSS